METASAADQPPGEAVSSPVTSDRDSNPHAAHPYVVRLIVGALIGFAGVSILVGSGTTWFGYTNNLTQGLLYSLGYTVTAVGALLVAWSWSALGSRLGTIIAVSIPGAWVAAVATVVEWYLWSGSPFGEMGLTAIATYGLLWGVFGPPLVLWARRSAQRGKLPSTSSAVTIGRGRMTRFERWLLLVTAFPGFTALLAVLLDKWIK